MARPHRWTASPSGWRLAIVMVAVAVVDLVLLVKRAMLDTVSPFDEGYHLSYVQYAYQWSVPRIGDPMLRWSEEAYACFPTFPYGEVTAVPCGVDGDSTSYPESGTNTAAGWPPGYYFVAAQFVRLLVPLTGLDPLHAARLASGALWTAGSVLVALVVVRLSGSLAVGASAGVLASAIPLAWAIGSYVTPHSVALVVGAALVALVRWLTARTRSRLSMLAAPTLLGLAIALFIPHGIVAALATAVALVALALHRRPQVPLLVVGALALVGSNGLGYVAWSHVASMRQVGATAPQPQSLPEGIALAVRDNWDLFVPRMLIDVPFLGADQTQIARATAYVLVGFLGYWVIRHGMPLQRAIALGLLVAAPVMAVVFALQFNFPVPPRYGATLLALQLVLLAVRGVSRWLVAGVCVVTVAAVVAAWISIDTYMAMS